MFSNLFFEVKHTKKNVSGPRSISSFFICGTDHAGDCVVHFRKIGSVGNSSNINMSLIETGGVHAYFKSVSNLYSDSKIISDLPPFSGKNI